MYLWNTKALAKKLKERTLSESDKFKYYIVVVILYTILLMLPTRGESTNTTDSLIGILIAILAIFFGSYICYKVNKSGDNVNFVERFICLSLPIAIKIFLLWVLVVILTVFSTFILGFTGVLDSPSNGTFFILKSLSLLLLLLVILLVWISFYWRIYVHMKWISHNNNDILNS